MPIDRPCDLLSSCKYSSALYSCRESIIDVKSSMSTDDFCRKDLNSSSGTKPKLNHVNFLVQRLNYLLFYGLRIAWSVDLCRDNGTFDLSFIDEAFQLLIRYILFYKCFNDREIYQFRLHDIEGHSYLRSLWNGWVKDLQLTWIFLNTTIFWSSCALQSNFHKLEASLGHVFIGLPDGTSTRWSLQHHFNLNRFQLPSE